MPANEFDRLLAAELARLTDTERAVLEMRFGLLDGLPRTLAQIGASYGLTRERIRQLDQRAVLKLRYRKRSEPLYRYVHGRRADTKRWNELGVDYMLDELLKGGRRNRLEPSEPPLTTRRRKLPIGSRRIVELIAQGLSYGGILAADRGLRPEDIARAASDLLAIVDGKPPSPKVKRAAPRRSGGSPPATTDRRMEGAETVARRRDTPQRANATAPVFVAPQEASGSTRVQRVWRTEERPPPAKVRPWLPEDDEELRRLYAEGRHLAEIASLIGRRFGQVQSRIVRLDLTR